MPDRPPAPSLDADDRFAITNLVHSYPYLLDRGDFEGVGRLFADAVIYNGGHLMADRDEGQVVAAYRDWLHLYEEGCPRTRHCIFNLMIEPDGIDRAIVRSYVMVLQQTDRLPLQPIIAGDYRDVVEKRDGVWRFVERRMGTDLVGDLSAHGRDAGVIQRVRANG